MIQRQMNTYMDIQTNNDKDYSYINKQINTQRNEFLRLEQKMTMEVQPRLE